MDDFCIIGDFWIRFVSAFSLFCEHFRASTTQNDLRATLAPQVLSSKHFLINANLFEGAINAATRVPGSL